MSQFIVYNYVFAYGLAVLTGFVFAGFVSSSWPLITRRDVSFKLLYPAGNLMLLEVFIVVFSVPLLLLKIGVAQLAKGRYRSLAWACVAGSIFTGFFQGVAVLSLV